MHAAVVRARLHARLGGARAGRPTGRVAAISAAQARPTTPAPMTTTSTSVSRPTSRGPAGWLPTRRFMRPAAAAGRRRRAARAVAPPGRRACEEPEGAAVERFERRVGGVPAAAPADVRRDDRRHVHRPPAGVLQPAAEVGVLPVEKERLRRSPPTASKASRRTHMQAPDTQSTSTGVARIGIARRQVVTRDRIARQHLREPRAASGDRGREVGKAARRGLDGAVGVHGCAGRPRPRRDGRSSQSASAAHAPGSTTQSGLRSRR